MNGTADAVRRAANIQDAVILLAEALDRVEDRLAELGTQDTGTWAGSWQPASDEWQPQQLVAPAAEAQPERDEAAIAALRDALATATDTDERRALEAALRLADETGIIPAGEYAEAGVGATVIQDEDSVLVELPSADPGRQETRRQWAASVRLGTMFTPAMDEAEAADAYAKGGPLWLYYGNDELVRGLPVGWKQLMVADIEIDSPLTAQVVARDILKADLDDARGTAPGLSELPGALV